MYFIKSKVTGERYGNINGYENYDQALVEFSNYTIEETLELDLIIEVV